MTNSQDSFNEKETLNGKEGKFENDVDQINDFKILYQLNFLLKKLILKSQMGTSLNKPNKNL